MGIPSAQHEGEPSRTVIAPASEPHAEPGLLAPPVLPLPCTDPALANSQALPSNLPEPLLPRPPPDQDQPMEDIGILPIPATTPIMPPLAACPAPASIPPNAQPIHPGAGILATPPDQGPIPVNVKPRFDLNLRSKSASDTLSCDMRPEHLSVTTHPLSSIPLHRAQPSVTNVNPCLELPRPGLPTHSLPET